MIKSCVCHLAWKKRKRLLLVSLILIGFTVFLKCQLEEVSREQSGYVVKEAKAPETDTGNHVLVNMDQLPVVNLSAKLARYQGISDEDKTQAVAQFTGEKNKSNLSTTRELTGMDPILVDNNEHHDKGIDIHISPSRLGDSNVKQSPLRARTRQKYMIYSCLDRKDYCGGLTDRIKGMVITYLISLLTNRTFGVKITTPACNFSFYFDETKITWNIKEEELQGLTRQTSKHVDDKLFRKSMSVIDFNMLYRHDVILFNTNYHSWQYLKRNKMYEIQLGRLLNYTVEQLFAEMVPKLFPLSRLMQQYLQKLRRLRDPSGTGTLVCAHIRMGKNPSNPLEDLIFMNVADAMMILNFLAQKVKNRNTSVFVASDSNEVRNLSRAKFPKQIIDTPGQAVHIDRDRYLPNVCEGQEKAIIEQRLLAQCDVLVITAGAFAQMASFIREKKGGLFCFHNKTVLPCKWHDGEDRYVQTN